MNKLTPEQRVIEILKDRLPIDMHHYQYQALAEEILTATTEEDKCDTCVHGGYINEKVRLSEQGMAPREVSNKQCWSCQLGTGESYCEQDNK